jgi:hypothetical protein
VADLITTDQFTDRTGRTLTASQTTQVEAFITDASALVVDIVNDSDTTDTWDAASAGTVPASIVPVVVNMVRRALDNPHGYTSEGVGSYNYNGGKTEGIFATRLEERTIRKAASLAGFGSINLESDLPLRHYDVWLDGAL